MCNVISNKVVLDDVQVLVVSTDNTAECLMS